MVSKVDTFKVYVLSLDGDEIETIVNALYDIGEDELGDAIAEMISSEPSDECNGPKWMREAINGLLDEIYRQSKDGRKIIMQERN